MSKIIERDRHVIELLRKLYVESGAEIWHKPEEFGGLNTMRQSKTGNLELLFDDGIPQELFVPEGFYTLIGSHMPGDTDVFWNKLNEHFNVVEVEPRIPNEQAHYRYTKPLVALLPK